MAITSKKIVFSAEIENKYDKTSKGDYLRFSRSQKEENLASRVEKIARNVISDQLPSDLRKIFDLKVQSQIIAVREGSVLLFFEILLGAYNIIGGYKGFYEGVELIKTHCKRLLESSLFNEFREDFEITVRAEFPSVSEPVEYSMRRWFDHSRHFQKEGFPFLPISQQSARRDGLFYFLIISNIILLFIIGLLVYGTVVKTYFPDNKKVNTIEKTEKVLIDTLGNDSIRKK